MIIKAIVIGVAAYGGSKLAFEGAKIVGEKMGATKGSSTPLGSLGGVVGTMAGAAEIEKHRTTIEVAGAALAALIAIKLL